ncbi:MAG: pyrimidine 5'-nucleotidase [Rhodocyclaceae bacterium]
MSLPVWLFDLDNTLHDAIPHVFPHINRSMTGYLVRELGLSEAQAGELRLRYWRRYGATLLGLMRHHGTDPRHFLSETHRFPDLRAMVVHEPALRHALRALPGRRLVFSNAPRGYAEAVLDVMGVRALFETVFSIERMRYRPKPARRTFLRLLRVLGVGPARCVMVEDSAENLRTAKALGMTTVWISPAARQPGFVDLRLRSVIELPRHLHRLI